MAQQAVNNLRSAGVSDRDITVISSEPFDHFEFGHRDCEDGDAVDRHRGRRCSAWSRPITCWALSQMSWPLKTAGMPIVPLWTNLIIIFEMTMLSAIIATVITLLITAGLPSRGGKLYDPEVSDGYILVGVENPSDAPRLESALAHRRRSRQDDLVHGLHGLHGLPRRRTHGQPDCRPRSAAPGFAGRVRNQRMRENE